MPENNDLVLVEVDEGVATVTLNRPERRNALSRALFTRIQEVMRALDADDAVDAIVLTGADPAFCAGVDLKEAAEDGGLLGGDGSVDFPEKGLLPDVATPVIGAVNGPVATGGLELALGCDFLVASERARFADTHARVGVMPGGGMTVRLPRLIGTARAKEMSTTGNYIDAATAEAWGLVNHVVPHDELLSFARRLAADIVSNDARAVRRVLEMYDEGTATTEAEAWDVERRHASDWGAAGIDRDQLARRRDAVIARAHGAGGAVG